MWVDCKVSLAVIYVDLFIVKSGRLFFQSRGAVRVLNSDVISNNANKTAAAVYCGHSCYFVLA